MTGGFQRPNTHDECDCCDELRDTVGQLDRAIVDLRGVSGDNGKLGELKRRVDTSDARRWQVVASMIALIFVVLCTAVAMGRWIGSLETDVETLKSRATRSRFWGDAPAAKDTGQ
jgi:hypothetical protein